MIRALIGEKQASEGYDIFSNRDIHDIDKQMIWHSCNGVITKNLFRLNAFTSEWHLLSYNKIFVTSKNGLENV